jgi:ParB family chromosome partitioning protein
MAGLGRGLGSLIPAKTNNEGVSGASHSAGVIDRGDREQVTKVDPAEIVPNPKQPRQNFTESALEELVESIREQ